MAYVSQDLKKKLSPEIKSVLAKYGMKGSIAVRHHSTLVINIKSGNLDLIGDFNKDNQKNHASGYLDVNVYHLDFYGRNNKKINDFYNELLTAAKGDEWFDKSDIMTDYFHTAYYIDINVGKWDKPYIFTA